MADANRTIIYNVTGQVLELYPPEWALGIPSSATYSVWAANVGDDDTAEFSGSATIDSVSTTVDAASGASQSDPRKINLTSTSGITVGRWYLLTNAAGQTEMVRADEVVTNDYIRASAPLSYDYAASDTFKGLRIYFTVDPTFVATETKLANSYNPYRVRWSYTEGGISRRHATYFDLVRYQKEHNVTPDDLAEIQGDIELEDKISRIILYIDAAWERVQKDLTFRNIKAHQIRDAQLRDEIVRCCALLVAAEDGVIPGGRDNETVVLERRQRYMNDLESFVRVVQLDQGLEGNRSGSPIRQVNFIR